MNLAIKVVAIQGGDFLAQIDWSKGDGGNVGTPGAVKYGVTEKEAYDNLKSLLELKGHNVIK